MRIASDEVRVAISRCTKVLDINSHDIGEEFHPIGRISEGENELSIEDLQTVICAHIEIENNSRRQKHDIMLDLAGIDADAVSAEHAHGGEKEK
jgi:hypothetical protein